MKHPSQDYDVTTSRYQNGLDYLATDLDAFIAQALADNSFNIVEFEGLPELAEPLGLTVRFDRSAWSFSLYRDGACVAQWAVIR